MKIRPTPVVTEYSATVEWYLDGQKLYDLDYSESVYRAAYRAIGRLTPSPTCDEDTQFRTQFHGIRIVGDNADEVANIAMTAAAAVSKFKHVISIE